MLWSVCSHSVTSTDRNQRLGVLCQYVHEISYARAWEQEAKSWTCWHDCTCLAFHCGRSKSALTIGAPFFFFHFFRMPSALCGKGICIGFGSPGGNTCPRWPWESDNGYNEAMIITKQFLDLVLPSAARLLTSCLIFAFHVLLYCKSRHYEISTQK